MTVPDFIHARLEIPTPLHARVVIANVNHNVTAGTRITQADFLLKLIDMGLKQIETDPEVKNFIKTLDGTGTNTGGTH